MIFLRRFSNSIRTVINQGTRPFRNVGNQARRLRSNNIFTQGKRQLGSVQNRLKYYTRLPKKYLGISTKSGKSADDDYEEKEREEHDASTDYANIYALGSSAESLHKRQVVRRNRQKPAVMMQETQVYLLDKVSGQVEIIHLGMVSGQSQVEHVINGASVVFAQVPSDIENPDNMILVSPLSPNIKVNGQDLRETIFLPQGSELNINGRRFRVDLQSSAKLNPRAYVQAVWETNVGPVRRENEDAIGIYKSHDANLFAIADGVGSGYGGDKMSEFAINYLLSAFDLNYERDIAWDEVLSKAVQNANIEMRNFLRGLQQHAGTTLTAIVVEGWTATVLHVGDSRLYLLRNHVLEQVTQDHSEEVPVDDSTTHDVVETRVVLAKAVGKAERIDPDLLTLPLQAGDRLLLCTDGVTARIPDSELAEILTDTPSKTVAQHLINLTNERHTTDNSSVVVVDVLQQKTINSGWELSPKDRVFTGDDEHVFRYKKLEKISVKKTGTEDTSDDDETGIGCGCVTLTLLILAFAFTILWGSGILSNWLEDNSLNQTIEQVVAPSQAFNSENSQTEIPNTPVQLSGTLTINTSEAVIVSPSPIITPIIVTIAPSSTSSRNVAIEIVSPTITQVAGETSTVRPTNPPR